MKRTVLIAVAGLALIGPIAGCQSEAEKLVTEGVSLYEAGQFDKARKKLETAVDHLPADSKALFYLGRQVEALRYFEEYAAISPTGGRIDSVYYFMGEIFIQQGRYNNADIALSTALYHSPNVADWWARLGYAREKGGDFQWSLEAYNKALALNPNLVDAVRGRSRVERQL